MKGPKEKKERALGTKLFLKAERCNSPKCVMIRRPYRPGMHGKRRSMVSEFGRQLKEKQKIQISFGLRDRQMRKLFKNLASQKGLSGKAILNILEQRLDNAVYRSGFAPSRIVARQLISHGHFLVNGRKVSVPSYAVKVGDKIGIRPSSKNKRVFEDLSLRLKKHDPPAWIKLDKENLVGEIKGKPEEGEIQFDPNLVSEYYSR